MKDWIGKTVDGTFAVQFQAPLLHALDRLCDEAGASETGGILIGRYSDDLSLAIVREATAPPSDSRRGRSWFVRGVNGLRELLGKKWRAKERIHYVGEWHFHPVGCVEPSGDDYKQMREISLSKQYDCKEPLLLIFGTGREQEQRSFRAFVGAANSMPLELLHEKRAHGERDDTVLKT